MSTIQGTDGDTTGALITTATTATELTALIEAATSMASGAMTPAEFDKLAALNAASATDPGTMSIADFNKLATVPTASMLSFIPTVAAIDLVAAPADYVVLPAMPYRISTVVSQWTIRTTGGTISTSPTFSLGTDATFSNLCAAQTKAGFTTQAANTQVAASLISPIANLDLTGGPLKIRISIAATGVAPVLTAAPIILFVLIPV